MTLDGEVLGTLAYMAPEQARGDTESTGFTSDVFSLGAILYHVLSGLPPYDSRKGNDMGAVLSSGATSASSIAPNDPRRHPRRTRLHLRTGDGARTTGPVRECFRPSLRTYERISKFASFGRTAPVRSSNFASG